MKFGKMIATVTVAAVLTMPIFSQAALAAGTSYFIPYKVVGNSIVVGNSGTSVQSYVPVTSTAKPATTTATTPKATTVPVKKLTLSNTGSLSSQESQMISYINADRQKNGLQPFSVDPILSKVAEFKSLDMYNNRYFSHTSPTYGSLSQLYKQLGYNSASAENIARNGSTYKAHAALMASPSHYKNLMSPNFTRIGVGIVVDGNGFVTVTQHFGR